MSFTPEEEIALRALLAVTNKTISDLEAAPTLADDMLTPVENGAGTFAASLLDVKNYAVKTFAVGAIMPFAGSALPSGFLAANGAAVSRTTYAALFAAIVTADAFSAQTFTVTIATPAVFTKSSHGFLGGERIRLTTTGALPTGLSTGVDYFVKYINSSTFKLATTLEGADINTTGSQSGTHSFTQSRYGLGDGSSTFNVPDLRDQFARGYSSSRTLGTGQLDAFQGHYHKVQVAANVGGATEQNLGTTAGDGTNIEQPVGSFAATILTDGTNGTPRIASETRPVNTALNYCIKY